MKLSDSHQRAQELMTKALDFPLSREHQAALESHLRSCPECQALFEQNLRLQSALQSALESALQKRWGTGIRRISAREVVMKNRVLNLTSLAFSGLFLLGLAFLAWWVFPHALALAAQPAASPDGLLLFNLQTAPGEWAIAVADTAGKLPDRLLTPGGADTSPHWSPDGKKIAFLRIENGQTDVFIINAAGTELKALTRSAQREIALAWSPDGEKIAFIRQENEAESLFILSVAQPEIAHLLAENVSGFPLAWSPNGQFLLVGMQNGGLWTVSTFDGKAQPWFAGEFVDQAAWLDAETLAAVQAQPGENPSWRLWQLSLRQSEPRLLAQTSTPIAHWFWDGKRITYLVKSWNSLAWYEPGGKMLNTWKNFAEECDSWPKDLYLGAPSLFPSPDGQRLLAALSCPDGQNWYYVLDATGERTQRLNLNALPSVPNSGGGEYAWSPRGDYVALILPTGENSSQAWLLPLLGADLPREAQPLMSENSLRVSPAWQP